MIPYIDRRYFRYFDWYSFILMLILAAIGCAFVYSATYKPDEPSSLFFKKQLLGNICGLGIYILFCLINYKTLMRWGYFIYFAVVGLLLFTMLKGSVAMGGQRWLNFMFFKAQPSELAKLLFPAYAAFYFYTEKDQLSFSVKQIMPVLVMLAISVLLILKQPDLGNILPHVPEVLQRINHAFLRMYSAHRSCIGKVDQIHKNGKIMGRYAQ